MEFLLFLEAIFTFCDPAMQYAGLNVLPVWTAFAIAGGLYAVVYAFKAIGLLVMAKKQGKTKLAWCAFIPFASTFLLGELAGELRFGSVKVKHLGIIAMVMELIYTFSGVFVIGWQANLISGGSYIVERVLNNEGDVIWYTTVFEGVSQQLQTLLNVFSVIKLVFKFVQLIAFIFLNIAFFRRYAPLSYIWMVLFCAILPPVEAFLVFAYRNRKPIDFDAYMKERAERIRRAQQAQFGPYGPYGQNPYGQNPYGQNPYGQNPYGQNPYGQNPYGQNPNANAPSEPDDPFGEFSSPRPQQPSQGQDGNADGSKDKNDDDFFS